jgi:hypothetical protein
MAKPYEPYLHKHSPSAPSERNNNARQGGIVAGFGGSIELELAKPYRKLRRKGWRQELAVARGR